MRSVFTLLLGLITGAVVFVSGCREAADPISASGQRGHLSPRVNGLAKGEFPFTLTSYSYSSSANRSSFTWEVISPASPAIEYWFLANLCREPVLVSSTDPVTSYEQHPETGYWGLKFGTPFGADEVREVTVVLYGYWEAGPVDGIIGTGDGYMTETIEGPVCEGVTPISYSISGFVFFDINANGSMDTGEPALTETEVTLSTGETVSSGKDGSYRFDNLSPGTYTVSLGSSAGRAVTIVDTDVENVNLGQGFDLSAIDGLRADGFTVQYWKTQLKKALTGKGKPKVSAFVLQGYQVTLSTFLLPPLNVSSLQEMYDILSAHDKDPVVALAKELLASELNFLAGEYIGGNRALTENFLLYGEFLVQYNSQFTARQLKDAAKIFKKYNKSNGGELDIL